MVTSGNASKFNFGITKYADTMSVISAITTNKRLMTAQSIIRFNMRVLPYLVVMRIEPALCNLRGDKKSTLCDNACTRF
uniref:Uncharacterized protein n=1 Tax=Magnetococcus massalia (strain MO-1) TaxID=451514 RepID=A0A1S7LJS5_MAGMO|nr:protein of unknown function [Candidatus Magnetococcus massalia]